MSLKLFLLRKTKALFIRFKLHNIFEPISPALLDLAYLSKVSKWSAENKQKFALNDFYASEWDYTKRYKLYEFLLKNEKLTDAITYVEFGVCEGHSFKWWVANNTNPASTFAGFDTFEGLPEDWGGFKAGEMSTGSNFPDVKDSRAKFLKGLFQDTLPPYIRQGFAAQRKVIHMDADLYSSTLYVLTSLAPYLNSGDIILFDEFNVPQHEFLAYMNFTQSYYIQLEPVVALNNYFFVGFKVK